METNTQSEPSVVHVVTEIVEDFQHLVQQQIDLVRAELKSDWEKSKQALWPLAAGAVVMLTALPILGASLALLIYWATLPADVATPGWPLWSCFGLAGILFAGMGGCLLYVGINRFQSFNPAPDESFKALKEMIQ